MRVNPVGSTISLDRYGNVVDVSGSLAERYTFLGVVWRLSLRRTALSGAGIYATLSFTTPDSGLILLASANVEKTGNEVEFDLIEGGTYEGGTIEEAVNPNRHAVSTYSLVSPLVDSYYGVSPTATLTGGINIGSYLLTGESQGNIKPGGASAMEPYILSKSTRYTLVMTALGATTVESRALMAYLSSA